MLNKSITMENPNLKEWSPNYPVPQSELPAYRKKIAAMMKEVAAEIEQVKDQPFDEKDIWATVGTIRYGHPVTPLILKYKALMWYHLKPPDPRGEPMCSRPAPYTIFVRRADLVDILPYEKSTIDRMLAEVREKFYIEPYKKITVELFCYAHNLPEDKIQQQLDDLFKKRFRKHKRPMNE
jgi:hypothetical protein